MTDAGLRFVRDSISVGDLAAMAEATFGDMVKAVVDLGRDVMVVGGEMQADAEAALLDDGAEQSSLWGINLYPAAQGDAFIEFDSMINVRPRAGNPSRSVTAPELQAAIRALVAKRVAR